MATRGCIVSDDIPMMPFDMIESISLGAFGFAKSQCETWCSVKKFVSEHGMLQKTRNQIRLPGISWGRLSLSFLICRMMNNAIYKVKTEVMFQDSRPVKRFLHPC